MKILLIFSIIVLLSSCNIKQKIENNSTQERKSIEQNIKTEKKETTKKEENNIENKKDISLNNKEKYALKGLIISGTIHLKNDEYFLALKNFLDAYKRQKGDPKIEKRIADTYFLMKKWNKAFEYYNKIDDPKIIYKDKYIKSYFYSFDLNKLKHNKDYLSGAIDKINSIDILNKEEKFYYSNSLVCIKDFSLCKKNYQDYLEKEKTINFQGLKDIQKALEDYKNFKIDELYFKNTLIVGAFFKNDLYSPVIVLGEEILKEKPNYKPILKMIAQSYFELGDYKNAKKYLTSYYSLDSNDKDVLYLLAIISQKTRDFVLSNIYLSKAEKLGYQPVSNINRLQVYNAYILDDTGKILSNFDKLIKNQEKPLFNDLVLATYYNLINGNIKKGEEYAQLGMTLYPKREDFYGFEGWILIEKDKLEQAKIILEKGYRINNNNALINLNLGRLEEKKGNKLPAKLYYKRAIKLDNGGEISKISAKKLEQLEKNNTSSGTTNTGVIN